MFSIYGVSGRSFRGTLEALGPLSGLSAARRGRGIAREGEELGPEMFVLEKPLTGVGEEEAGRYRQATEAYRRMLQGESERGPIHHAYQVMSRGVETLDPATRVEEAWRFLVSRGYGQAPVLGAAQGLVGMVSVKDLLAVLNVDVAGIRDVRARRVADVMASPVITTDPVSDIRRVARVLLDYDLTGLPVVGEQDDLVGIVTRGDILRQVINEPPLSLWA